MKTKLKKTTSKSPDATTVESKIKKVAQLPFVFSALFYGRSGSGKTTLAATFPKPILLLDIREQGTDSIRDIDGVFVISIEKWDEIEEIYWYLKTGKHNFKTVVIDTVTQMQDIAMAKVLELEGRPNEPATKRTWGSLAEMMKTWIIMFRDLPMNVVFLAQDRRTDREEEEPEEDQLSPEVGPRVSPAIAACLNGAVKIIGQTYIKEVFHKNAKGKLKRSVEYRLRIGPHSYYLTKIRKPKQQPVPAYIVDPTYDKLVSVIKGKIEEEKKNA